MERCGARRSFEKPRVEAPPRLQVIGFDVPSPMKAAEAAPATSKRSLDMVSSATASYNELPISPSQLSRHVASSPRSALQQLLLHQSLPSTSPTSSNHSLPPLKSSPNQNSKLGLLLPDISSPAAAANQKRPISGGLLQPSTSPFPANQISTSGISKLNQSPPSAYQSNSSSGRLKSLVQSELTTSDISANQSSHTSFFSSLSQSQYANSSVPSGGSQMINQRNAKPAKAVIKENYEAFFQIKKTGDYGNGAKAHEVYKGRWISTKPNHSHAAKSKKSSWLQYNDGSEDEDDDDEYEHPSRCKESSWKKGVQPMTAHSPSCNEKSRKSSRNEEKSKKSSVFIMFVASSPAPDYHYQGDSAEHNASKTMDFLSSCHLCRRPLGQGQDVFMYSGDKAFCSMECRYQQIVIDERKERCPPPIIRSGASPVFHHDSITATATHRPIMINKPYFINTAAVA